MKIVASGQGKSGCDGDGPDRHAGSDMLSEHCLDAEALEDLFVHDVVGASRRFLGRLE